MIIDRKYSTKTICLLLVVHAVTFIAYGQTYDSDTLLTERQKFMIDSIMNRPRGIQKIANYYDKSTEEPNHRFSVTFAGAPFYTQETSLGIGAMATGLYRPNWNDTISRLSDISIMGNVTITGSYSFLLEGNHNAAKDLVRIYYKVLYNSFPTSYWGTGFESGDDNNNKTKYTKNTLSAVLQPTFRIAKNIYIGPSVSYDYIKGVNFKSDSLLFGEDKSSSALNLGVMFTIDSRDVSYNAYQGVYLKLEQRNYMHFGGNKPFYKTIGDFRNYNRIWEGAVLAFRAYAEFSYGTVPWTMKARGNGNSLLRSYYAGRYEDDNILDVTLELRQRIWKRLGAVAWVGAGNMFSDAEPFDWKHTLSDLGVGLRWEFKKRINIRLDYGIGRCGQSAFVFGIREAF